MGQLEGKTAIITGAARGQGEAEARLFVAEGANVVLGDIRDERGEALAAELGGAAVYRRLDVTSADDWEAAVAFTLERFGKVDVLVNNAGVLFSGPIETQPLEDYQRIIGVNQIGVWLGMKNVVSAMRDGGGGSIVNISSNTGLVGVGGLAAYSSTKWAIRGLTRAAALEFALYGIRVNSVHPGLVDTEMGPEAGLENQREIGAATTPLGRIAEPEDIARMVLFLASDASSYCSGAEFTVDGGQMTGLSATAAVEEVAAEIR